MIINGEQEREELKKQKKKIAKLKKAQDEFEKDKIWEEIPNIPGNAKRLVR